MWKNFKIRKLSSKSFGIITLVKCSRDKKAVSGIEWNQESVGKWFWSSNDP